MADSSQGATIDIPLPGDAKIPLVEVFLGLDATKILDAREMTLGDRTENGFAEALVQCSLSGSFIGKGADGKPDWYLLIGETEVTRTQWSAVMGEPAPPAAEKDLPKVGVTYAEIQAFLQQLNQIAAKSAASTLPRSLGGQGFFRLLTEAEWEFCARGGLPAIKAGTFDNPTPYADGTLGEYEATFSNFRGQVAEVTALSPNPAGLRHMLGNVAEFVEGNYSLEYFQGRLGGLVVRGGSVNDPDDAIRASKRTETQPVGSDGESIRHPLRGFRVAYASAVLNNKISLEDIGKSWKDYVNHRAVVRPIPVAQDTNRNVSGELASAQARLSAIQDRMSAQLTASADKTASLQKTTDRQMQEINQLRMELSNASSMIFSAAKRDAASWVRIGSYANQEVFLRKKSIEAWKEVGGQDKTVGNLEKQMSQQEGVVDDAIQSLRRIDRDLVLEALRDREKFYRERNEFEIVQPAFEDFRDRASRTP